VSFLFDSGGGILLLTIFACALVVAATTLVAMVALALVVWSLRLLAKLKRA
jgi:hypothetical protein